MKNTNVRIIADAAMGAALCTLLYIVSLYVPFLSPFTAFVCSAPLMYLACKRGTFAAISAFVVSIGALFAITGNILSSLLFAAAYALPGMVFGIMVSHNKKFYITLFVTSLAVMVGTMLELIVMNGSGDGIRNMLSEITSGMENTLLQLLSANEFPKGMDITRVVPQMIANVIDLFMLFLPAVVIISSAIYAYALSVFGVFLLKRLRVKKINYIKFSMMKAPRSLCYVTAILFLICKFADGDGIVFAALQNLLIVLGGAISICGFSFIDWAFSKKVASGYIRTIIYCAIIIVGFALSPLIINIFMFLGYLDGFWQFRASVNTGDDRLENK